MAIHEIEIINNTYKLENTDYFEKIIADTSTDIIDACFSKSQEIYGSIQNCITNNFKLIRNLKNDSDTKKHLLLIDDEFKKFCLISCLYTAKLLIMENEQIEITKLENELKYFGNDYMNGIIFSEFHRNKKKTYKFNHILEYYNSYEGQYKDNSNSNFGGYDYLYSYFNFYKPKCKDNDEDNKIFYTDLFLSNFTYRYLSTTNNNKKMWSYLKEYVEVINGDSSTDKKNLKRSRYNVQCWIKDMLSGLRPYSYNYMKEIDTLLYHYKYDRIMHLNYLKRYGSEHKNKGYKSLSDKELDTFINYHNKIINLQNSILNTHLLEVLDYIYDDYVNCLHTKKQCEDLPWFIDKLIEYIEQFTKCLFLMLYDMCFSKSSDISKALKVVYNTVLKKLKPNFDSDIEKICDPHYLDFEYDFINDNDIIYIRTLVNSFLIDMFN